TASASIFGCEGGRIITSVPILFPLRQWRGVLPWPWCLPWPCFVLMRGGRGCTSPLAYPYHCTLFTWRVQQTKTHLKNLKSRTPTAASRMRLLFATVFAWHPACPTLGSAKHSVHHWDGIRLATAAVFRQSLNLFHPSHQMLPWLLPSVGCPLLNTHPSGPPSSAAQS